MAAAAREPDEGEVKATRRQRKGGAAVSLENDSQFATEVSIEGHQPSTLPVPSPLCPD